MIKTINTLTCKFIDNLGKSRMVNIDNPKEGLTVEDIERFMNYTIDVDVVMPNSEDPEVYLALVGGASLTSKVVENIEIS